MSKRAVASITCCVFITTGCGNMGGFGLPFSANHATIDAPGSAPSALNTEPDRAFAARPNYAADLKAGGRIPIKLGAPIARDKVKTDVQALAAEGMSALRFGRLEEASQLFNTALRLDLGNSSLQFMNALTYHLMALNGDSEKFSLAEQGYSLAHKFDPTSVLSMYYQGLAFLDQRKFDEAKGAFAIAAVMEDGDPEILYDLARAAYYGGDPRTAKAALQKLASLNQSQVAQDKVLRASIVTDAALGNMASAKKLLERFKISMRSPEDGEYLARRINAWERVYASAPGSTPNSASGGKTSLDTPSTLQSIAQADQGFARPDANRTLLAQLLPQAAPGGVPVIPGAAPALSDGVGATGTGNGLRNAGGNAGIASGGSNSAEMTVVDVVIVGTQEDISENQGLNLLSGLQLQFGDPVARTPGLSSAANRVLDGAGGNNTITRTFTRLISIPAVTYSLNIFNTLNGRNEILARPSLVALANERSEFFAGVDVVGAAVSGGAGAPVSINKQIGVKLSIVPEFLSGDRIKLKVEAERTFITAPSRSVVFDFRLDTSKTNVSSNVVMRFGETLVLGGLTEKDTQTTRDATPLLGDIPIIQYLFARKSSTEFRKSVLILITPRRAQFTNQSAAERAKTEASLTDFEKSMDKFETRNKNWFVPLSGLTEGMASVEGNRLFQEFKTGDFALERWNARDTHEQRLGAIKNFLFF